MSAGDLTNGIESLPPRRRVESPIHSKAWRAVAAAGLVLAALSILLSVVLFAVYFSESSTRRDQNIETFVGDHRDEVAELVNSYYFVEHPFRDPGLNDAVLRSLPAQERRGLRDRAPDYCDEPGVGLPEPDPCFPRRPAVLGPGPHVPFQAECVRVRPLGG